MILINQNIQTCGTATELTRSQTDNFEIIQNHWRFFNTELKHLKFNQNKGNWTKYGITFKSNEKYFYLAAVPKNKDHVFPDYFTSLEIPKGEYQVFTHQGKMENIKHTLYQIYKVIVPQSNLNIENQAGFLHFEMYDHRFQWNRATSVIDIYLPINTNR